MENRNVILMAVAVVIVTAVGTFLAVSDDGCSPGVGIKTEFQPGDFVEAEMVQDGRQMDVRIVVLEDLGGGRVAFDMYVDGVPKHMESDASVLSGRLSADSGDYTDLKEIGRSEEYTYMGLRECVLWDGLYDGIGARVLADAETSLVYSIDLDGQGMKMSFRLKDTSFVNVFGPGPVPE